MYSRDPFNVRRNASASTLLRTNSGSLGDSAAQVTKRAVSAAESLFESGRQALQGGDARTSAHAANMTSYALPNGATTQNAEIWQSSGRSRFHHEAETTTNNIGNKMSNIFSERKDSLPMYKDKPYHYAQGRKRKPLQQKRFLFTGLGLLAFLSWWFGILSPLSMFSGGRSKPETKTKAETGWSFFGGKDTTDWADRAEKVKEAFKISFADYEKHGWGYDEYHPSSKSGKYMVPNTKGMGWIIVDALDTLMLMNLTTELEHARQWIHTDLSYDIDHDVNTFETTIRMLGGLLSAHYLSSAFPGVYAPVHDDLSNDMYVEKAADLAGRLLGAYNTQSGVPLASINMHKLEGIPSHADGGASSTAEATSLQLEMKYLAKLTGETHYWEKAERIMKVIDDNHPEDGLVPIFIYANPGTFRGDNIRLGSRGDSYYEYLIKQFLQTSRQEPVYEAMWNESMAGIKKHLLTYSSPNNYLVLAERPSGLHNALSPKMDHLVCFMPGTIALAATNGLPVAEARKQPNWCEQQEEDLHIAEELMKTCMGMYKTTATGLAPEIAHFRIHNPPLMYNDFTPKTRPKSPASFATCLNKACTETESTTKDDYDIHSSDVHNLQRPETVESLFYMWRITGDEKYRQWGWDMFQSFVKWSAVEDGTAFSSMSNVLATPPGLRDNMESFWLAETLKYFYLLFSSNDILPLTDVVFNTEAHPFPRFEMGKLFKTGWQRSAPGSQPSSASEGEKKPDDAHVVTQTVRVTSTREVMVTPIPLSDAPEKVTNDPVEALAELVMSEDIASATSLPTGV